MVISNSRTIHPPSMGFRGSYGAIPLTEIECFIRLYSVEDAETFVHHIRYMDRIYTSYQNDKLTERSKKS